MFEISVHFWNTRNEVHSSFSGFLLAGSVWTHQGHETNRPDDVWAALMQHQLAAYLHGNHLTSCSSSCCRCWRKHRNDLQQSDLKRNNTDSRELQMENGDLGHMVCVCVCVCAEVFSLLCFINVIIWQFSFLVRWWTVLDIWIMIAHAFMWGGCSSGGRAGRPVYRRLLVWFRVFFFFFLNSIPNLHCGQLRPIVTCWE